MSRIDDDCQAALPTLYLEKEAAVHSVSVAWFDFFLQKEAELQDLRIQSEQMNEPGLTFKMQCGKRNLSLVF